VATNSTQIDIASEIREVAVIPKNSRREVITTSNLHDCFKIKETYVHQILKVTLKHGYSHALDLAGAQFGYREALTGWDEYIRSRVLNSEAMVFNAHGYTKEKLMNLKPEEAEPANYLLTIWHAVVQQQLKAGTMDWDREHKSSVTKLLSLSGEAFYREENSLVDFIQPCLQSALDVIGKGTKGVKTRRIII
jgi:hypothetical protein